MSLEGQNILIGNLLKQMMLLFPLKDSLTELDMNMVKKIMNQVSGEQQIKKRHTKGRELGGRDLIVKHVLLHLDCNVPKHVEKRQQSLI